MWGPRRRSPVTYATVEHSICVIVCAGAHREGPSEHKPQGETQYVLLYMQRPRRRSPVNINHRGTLNMCYGICVNPEAGVQ